MRATTTGTGRLAAAWLASLSLSLCLLWVAGLLETGRTTAGDWWADWWMMRLCSQSTVAAPTARPCPVSETKTPVSNANTAETRDHPRTGSNNVETSRGDDGDTSHAAVSDGGGHSASPTTRQSHSTSTCVPSRHHPTKPPPNCWIVPCTGCSLPVGLHERIIGTHLVPFLGSKPTSSFQFYVKICVYNGYGLYMSLV